MPVLDPVARERRGGDPCDSHFTMPPCMPKAYRSYPAPAIRGLRTLPDFRFFVQDVTATPATMLFQLEAVLEFFLVLIGVVVDPVTISALETNEIILGHRRGN